MMKVIFFWTSNQHFKQAEGTNKRREVRCDLCQRDYEPMEGEKKSRDNVVLGFQIKIRTD